MGYYRALHEDAEQNRRLAATRLTIPVLALGGAASIAEGVALCMRRLAGQVDGDTVPGAGHWIAEEQPAWLAERLLAFFAASAAEARA